MFHRSFIIACYVVDDDVKKMSMLLMDVEKKLVLALWYYDACYYIVIIFVVYCYSTLLSLEKKIYIIHIHIVSDVVAVVVSVEYKLKKLLLKKNKKNFPDHIA